MDEMLNQLMSNPWFAVGVPAIIFLIALILLFKRILGFIFTMILFLVVVFTGFSVINNPKVQEFLGKDPAMQAKSFYERLMESWECLKHNFTSGSDETTSE